MANLILAKHMDVVFFFYGLTFFILGIAIFLQLRITQKSSFRLHDILWLLAWFGFTHGMNEFIDMFGIIKGELLFFKFLKPFILIISFFFLLAFGYKLINIENKKNLRSGFLALIIFSFLGLPVFLGISSSRIWQISARYFLCFPGALLSAVGIFLYYQCESEKLRKIPVKKYFLPASLFLGAYGILSGLIPPKEHFFLASVMNSEMFAAWAGIPVQGFRALCAMGIAWSVWHIVDIFNLEMEAEHKEIMEAMNAGKASFHNIVERNPDGMVVVDRQGIVRFLNSSSASFLDRKPERLLGRALNFPVKPGQVIEIGISRSDKANGIGEIQVTDTLWEDKIASLVMIRDITARKQTEEQQRMLLENLQIRNRELGSLIRIISHDLKEPLRSIYAYSKFLEDDYKDTLRPQDLEYLRRLRFNAVAMKNLFEDALEISTIERSHAQVELVSVSALLDEARLRLESTLKEKNVQLVIPDNLPRIFCDRLRMVEVFANLFSNAIKFNDNPQPTMEVSYAEKEDAHEFCVKDNGPGIEEQYFNKIFEIFQRLGNREAHEGTGAGLTIIKKIIEMHKGKIWVDSKVGEYTAFYFTIPKRKQGILGKKKIGEILIEKKLVTQEELKQALDEQGEA